MNSKSYDELYYLYRIGNKDATKAIYDLIEGKVTLKCMSLYKWINNKGMMDDMIREVFAEIWIEKDSYRKELGKTFPNYINMLASYRSATYCKNLMKRLNKESKYIYLDSTIEDGTDKTFNDIVADPSKEYRPDDRLDFDVTQTIFDRLLLPQLSQLEIDVLKLRREFYTNQNIAKMLGLEVRSVSNAVARIKVKMKIAKQVYEDECNNKKSSN